MQLAKTPNEVERDKLILRVLGDSTTMNFNQIVKKTGLTTNRVHRGLKSLIAAKTVSHLRRGGPYALMKYNHLIGREYEEYSLRKNRLEISPEARRRHSEDLKEEVIKPWINQLPTVEIDGVFSPDGYDLQRRRYVGDKLPVEDCELFEDFKLHYSFEIDPYQELEEVTKASKKFDKSRKDKIDIIWDNLKSKFEKDNIKRSNWPYDSGDLKDGIFTTYLPEQLLFLSFLKKEVGWSRIKREFLPLKSTIEKQVIHDGGSLYCYSLWGKYMVILSKDEDAEICKEKIDDNIMKLTSEIENGTLVDVTDLSEQLKEIHKKIDALKRCLQKNLKKVVFTGDCEYLR